jgi:hypothetical protein
VFPAHKKIIVISTNISTLRLVRTFRDCPFWPSLTRVRHRIKCHRFIVPFLKPFLPLLFFHHIKDDAIAMGKEFSSAIKTHTHTHTPFLHIYAMYMIDLKIIQLLESPIHGCWPLLTSCRSYAS